MHDPASETGCNRWMVAQRYLNEGSKADEERLDGPTSAFGLAPQAVRLLSANADRSRRSARSESGPSFRLADVAVAPAARGAGNGLSRAAPTC
jgi:hypothetical protein